MKIVAKVGKSGRAQIPLSVRQKMDICDGDQLIICIEQVIKTEPTTEDESIGIRHRTEVSQ